MKKRLRIFAGPNGSGKSTLTGIIRNKFNLGTYVNADDIKRDILASQRFEFSQYGLTVNKSVFETSVRKSEMLKELVNNCWSFENNGLSFNLNLLDDSFVTFLADFVRWSLLNQGERFSFETVMSHSSKLDFMKEAKNRGYKVYLYFVSLRDPHLNVLRVHTRVSQGGHDVDKDKIVNRYDRTMGYLFEALKIADSAFVFDNSGSELKLIAQKEKGVLKTLGEYVPSWYQTYVLDRIGE